jgi:hypothetical protein
MHRRHSQPRESALTGVPLETHSPPMDADQTRIRIDDGIDESALL